MSSLLAAERPVPPWLITESYEDRRLGTLKSGKEAEVFLVERIGTTGSCFLAHKRYRPRTPAYKGELRELGFSKGTIYRSDAVYRAGWNLNARDRRAVAKHTDHGRDVVAAAWPVNELQMLRRAWTAGVSVPYPVDVVDDGVLMEFCGEGPVAAPRLVDARLDQPGLANAWSQFADAIRALTRAGIVHADLSVYNLLWWRGRVVVIDFPQAVDVIVNPAAPGLLHRDVVNVATWFGRHGVHVDAERVFGGLLSEMW
ncbi:MAG: kinase 1 [Chloroflexota bacterium]|nr:kinase 1 [Chloroflexota bacterium]